ncbi:MAG: preprotein translocase subunit SecE [Firmicutes bacterium]|nr:preprotein translocase subunit SecE [Bacillota bacterium]
MADKVKDSKAKMAVKKFTKFFKEVKSELKKVVWLNRQQLFNNIVAVLVICFIFGVIIWIVDFGLSKIVELTLR